MTNDVENSMLSESK